MVSTAEPQPDCLNNDDSVLSLSFTPDEYAKLKAAAACIGINLHDFVERAAIKAAKAELLEP